MQVELRDWYLSRLECLNEIQWRGVKSHSVKLSLATSRIPSMVNTIWISLFRNTHVITSIKL